MVGFLSFEREMHRSGAGRPFANGFEGENWMDHWCGHCRFDEDGAGCVLVDVARMDRMPYMWERYVDSSLDWKYLCHAYRPKPETLARVPPLDTAPPQ